MSISKFILLLKTKSPDTELRFYCPIDEDYYYIKGTDIMGRGIIFLTKFRMFKDSTNDIETYGRFIRTLETYKDIIESDGLIEYPITFKCDHLEFRAVS